MVVIAPVLRRVIEALERRCDESLSDIVLTLQGLVEVLDDKAADRSDRRRESDRLRQQRWRQRSRENGVTVDVTVDVTDGVTGKHDLSLSDSEDLSDTRKKQEIAEDQDVIAGGVGTSARAR